MYAVRIVFSQTPNAAGILPFAGLEVVEVAGNTASRLARNQHAAVFARRSTAEAVAAAIDPTTHTLEYRVRARRYIAVTLDQLRGIIGA